MSDRAVGPDGKLLDAKDIDWYEDADASEPISQATTPSVTTTSSSAAIHPFFRGVLAPAVVVAGARRSGRATRPSNRITDPDNAEALSSATTHKRKASGGMAASRRINRKVAVDDEAGDTEPDDLAYASTKAMGDADREVRLFLSL